MNSKEAFQQVLNKVRNTSRWYEDELKLIQQDLDKLENLEKENQELKNTILSLELDTCVPELRKENTKLKNIIKILKDTLDPSVMEYNSMYIITTLMYNTFLTKEEYELLKETFEND